MKKSFLILVSLFIGLNTFAQGYKVGDKATDFSLKNIDETMFSMKNIRDAKGFIVIFSCNHCPFVKATEERMVELNKTYSKLGYPVIAINPNDPAQQPEDSFEEMKIRSEARQFNFPYLVDEDQKIAKTYGASRTPEVYLLQREGGDLIVKYIGAIDDNTRDANAVKEKFVENAVKMLLDGKDPDPKETKAIGCTIKWK